MLVCEGLGGVMAAACRGAAGADGTTVGILPGDDRAAADPWVAVALASGMGELRNGLVVRAAVRRLGVMASSARRPVSRGSMRRRPLRAAAERRVRLRIRGALDAYGAPDAAQAQREANLCSAQAADRAAEVTRALEREARA